MTKNIRNAIIASITLGTIAAVFAFSGISGHFLLFAFLFGLILILGFMLSTEYFLFFAAVCATVFIYEAVTIGHHFFFCLLKSFALAIYAVPLFLISRIITRNRSE